MKKLSVVLAVPIAGMALAAGALAQSSGASVTANAADKAAVATVKSAGKSGLLNSQVVSFSFQASVLATSQACPPGTTNPIYCTGKNFGGGYRFIMRFNDLRPGRHNRSFVAATLLNTQVFPNTTINVSATIRSRALAVLSYAQSHGRSVNVQLIQHVRPTGSTQSTEVFTFVLE